MSFIVFWLACAVETAPPEPTPGVAPAPAEVVAPEVPPPDEPAPVTARRAECTMEASCASECRSGDPLACSQLGIWAQYGLAGVTRDEERAAELQQRACDLGAGVGCFNLAAQRLHGIGVPKDIALSTALQVEAARLHERSCDAGANVWCVNLGMMLLLGQGVTPDQHRAVALLRKSCTAGEPHGCVGLASAIKRSDLGAARSLLQENCGKGQVLACGALGETYLDAVPPEPTNANVFFKMGCDGGDPVSCRNLGYQKLTGQGASLDVRAGLDLLAAACTSPQQPDGGACHLAGLTYLTGAEGVMPSPVAASENLALACRMGSPQACLTSAQLAAGGTVPGWGATEAQRFAEMACSMGQVDACKLLR
jgi:TPR repeat protein